MRILNLESLLQVFAIEFGDFATEFVPFAIEFVAFAIEFVPFAIEFVGFAIEFVPFAIEFVAFAIEFVAFAVKFVRITRMAAGANTKTWSSICYKNLFKYNSSKQLFISRITREQTRKHGVAAATRTCSSTTVVNNSL